MRGHRASMAVGFNPRKIKRKSPEEIIASGLSDAAVSQPHPRACKDGFLYNRLIAGELSEYITPFQGDQSEAEAYTGGFIEQCLPNAKGYQDFAETIHSPGQPLRALIVEELPEWKDGRRGEGNRHGQHLGIGHYVYDPDAEDWYLVARHGRGMHTASYRPYANTREASKRIRSLRAEIESGNYFGHKYNDPKSLVSKYAREDSLRRGRKLVEAREKAQKDLKKDKRKARRAPDSSSLLYG
jgi:hypothetical protein